MSASSFERALRDRAGCDPEPQARLNAKRAALEAFARRQAQGPSPDEEEGPRRFAPPTRYVGGRSRSESCFAGAASAAISGIGVLLLWAHAGTRVPPLEPFVVHLIPAAVIQYEVALPNVPAAPTRSARFEPSPPKPRSVVRAAPATSNSVRRVAEEIVQHRAGNRSLHRRDPGASFRVEAAILASRLGRAPPQPGRAAESKKGRGEAGARTLCVAACARVDCISISRLKDMLPWSERA